jgi:hypothetical protein
VFFETHIGPPLIDAVITVPFDEHATDDQFAFDGRVEGDVNPFKPVVVK